MATDISIHRPGYNRDRKSYSVTLIGESVRGTIALKRRFVLLGNQVTSSVDTLHELHELVETLVREFIEEDLILEIY